MIDKQVNNIKSASLSKIIAKREYNMNLALDIRGGPKELGGAGFYSFKNKIGVARVQYFITNWRTPIEDIGKILCITIS